MALALAAPARAFYAPRARAAAAPLRERASTSVRHILCYAHAIERTEPEHAATGTPSGLRPLLSPLCSCLVDILASGLSS